MSRQQQLQLIKRAPARETEPADPPPVRAEIARRWFTDTDTR